MWLQPERYVSKGKNIASRFRSRYSCLFDWLVRLTSCCIASHICHKLNVYLSFIFLMYIQFDISTIYHLIYILTCVYRDYTACHAIHLIHYDVVIFLLLFFLLFITCPKNGTILPTVSIFSSSETDVVRAYIRVKCL